MKKSFIIRDKLDRIWGEFDVLGDEQGKIYGYLNAAEGFENVRQVFLDHDKAVSDPQGNTEKTALRIVDLGAYLIDKQSGGVFDISNIIFVNENLLVTCETRPNQESNGKAE